MDEDNLEQRLSQIGTLWSVVCRANDGTGEEVATAREQLMDRYSKAVHRYLLGAVRDPDVADELAQEFALRLVQGDLRGANPDRGRFRNFVKGVLSHLIADHHRRRRVQPLPLGAGGEPEAAGQDPNLDSKFLDNWRAELLARTWKALERIQLQTGQMFYLVLRCRAENLKLSSAAMAAQLSEQLGKPVTGDWVRKNLERARSKFADLLLIEVAQTLEEPTLEELAREVADLGLLTYCRTALERHGRGASP